MNVKKRGAGTFFDESGVTILYVCMCLFVLVLSVSFTIDLGMAYYVQRRIHIAADAAALAGVAKYATVPESANQLSVAQASVVPEAKEIAFANSLTQQELDEGGGIMPGHWDSDTHFFTPDMLPLNALRVSARRNVPTFFSRIIGWTLLQPNVSSTAWIGVVKRTSCILPFGIDDDLISGKNFGDLIDIGFESPGNWGKLDLVENMSSGTNFRDAMRNGACGRRYSVGDLVSPGTGFAGVRPAFDERLETNPVVVFPIVDQFPIGNSAPVKIVGFVAFQIIDNESQGSHWTGEIKILDRYTGSSIGGPLQPPYASARALVQ